MKNPFLNKGLRRLGGGYCQTVDVAGRLEMVREFNAEQLRAVIELPGVQKTVRQAAEGRLRKLNHAEGVDLHKKPRVLAVYQGHLEQTYPKPKNSRVKKSHG